MSYRAVDYATKMIRKIDLTKSQANVYLSLADHANHETGRAFPSLTRLQDECKIGRRTVIRAIDHLVYNMLIDRIPTQGKNTEYELNIPEHWKQGQPLPGESAPDPLDETRRQSVDELQAAAAIRFHKFIGKTKEEYALEAFADSVPGIADPEECKRIHEALCLDPAYGDSPAQRIINGIIKRQHPNWAEADDA